MVKKFLLAFFIASAGLLLSSCCAQCVECDDHEDSAPDQGDMTISGTVYSISNGDTLALSNAQIMISYAYGHNFDCGWKYYETDTLHTDSLGVFTQEMKAYSECYYGYELSKLNHRGEKKSFSDGGNTKDGTLCAGELEGVKFYLESF